jgi:transcriptional regulator with XRE-family HTH domain
MSLEKKSGVYVLRLRKTAGLSQNKFAKIIGCTGGYISQLEGDRVDISLSTFITWTKLFKIKDMSVIVDDEIYEKHLRELAGNRSKEKAVRKKNIKIILDNNRLEKQAF